jgi:cell division protein FtsQ
MLDVHPGALERRLEALPWVSRAVVEQRWPSTVRVVVVERAAVLAVPAPDGATAVLDSTGRVLGIYARGKGAAEGLPVVRGLPPPGAPGTAIPGSGSPAVQDAISVASALPPSLAGKVASVSAAAGGELQLKLTSGIVVRFGGPEDLAPKVEALSAILASANLKGVATIDLRVPDAPVLTR